MALPLCEMCDSELSQYLKKKMSTLRIFYPEIIVTKDGHQRYLKAELPSLSSNFLYHFFF